MRLIEHLKSLGLSNREARAAMESGKVWVGLVPSRDAGREVDPATVELRPEAPRIVVGRDLVVVWRDAHVAVVCKPSGMLAVPAPRRSGTNVLAEVGRICGTAMPVHRLDEGTSGLMMVALDEPAQRGLKAQLEVHSVERCYLALARGRLRPERMRVESSLVRDRGDGLRGSADGEGAEGRLAVTHLRALEEVGACSVVEARLETGRTHQVRIHLLEQGCPILGDPLYGGPSVRQLAPRLALHAAVLGFEHPITGESLRFEIPLADDLEQLRRDLADGGRSGSRPPRKGGRKKKRRR